MGEFKKVAEQVGETGLSIATKKGAVMQVDELATAIRTLEKFGYNPGSSGNSLGARIEGAINQRLNDEIVGKLVGNMFGGVADSEPKPSYIKLTEKLMDSQFGHALGQRLGDYLGSGQMLKDPRLAAAFDSIMSQRDPNYQAPQQSEENGDINRNLMERYDRGLPSPPQQLTSAPTELFPTGNYGQSDDDFIMSLSPDDPISIQEYIAKRKMDGVDAVAVKKALIAEQERIRGNVGSVGGSGSVDSKSDIERLTSNMMKLAEIRDSDAKIFNANIFELDDRLKATETLMKKIADKLGIDSDQTVKEQKQEILHSTLQGSNVSIILPEGESPQDTVLSSSSVSNPVEIQSFEKKKFKIGKTESDEVVG